MLVIDVLRMTARWTLGQHTIMARRTFMRAFSAYRSRHWPLATAGVTSPSRCWHKGNLSRRWLPGVAGYDSVSAFIEMFLDDAGTTTQTLLPR